MDIWGWVDGTMEQLRSSGDAGQLRLAEIMEELPGVVMEQGGLRGVALHAEGVALARAQQRPWVEVYLRHWHIQNLLFHAGDARQGVAEAVSLLEFAHRSDTAECPQSVCAVDDLCAAYSLLDGPSFAEERLAVSREALARITPARNCFDCLSGQCADAMDDLGQTSEALRFLDAQQAQRMSSGVEDEAGAFCGQTRASLLLGLERYADALELVRSLDHEAREDRITALQNRCVRARALLGLGKTAEARRSLPTRLEAEDEPGVHSAWCHAVAAMVRAGALEATEVLRATVRRMATRMDQNGRVREAFHTFHLHGELALRLGVLHQAAWSARNMAALAAGFRRQAGADETLNAFQRQLDTALALQSARLPSTVEAFLAADDNDVPALGCAVAKWPGHPAVVRRAAQAWVSEDCALLAVDALTGLSSQHPDDAPTRMLLARTLVGARKTADAEALATRWAAQGSGALAAWLRALVAVQQGRVADAAALVAVAVTGLPEQAEVHSLAAEVAQQQQDWERVFLHARRALQCGADPTPEHARVLVAATVLQEWDAVRASWAALGEPPLPGDGATPEHLGPCLVRLPSDDGSDAPWGAVRTGAARVLVTDLSLPGTEQHTADVWVVGWPAEPELRDGRPVFRAVHRVSAGDLVTYAVWGALDDGLWKRLSAAARTLGGAVQAAGESEAARDTWLPLTLLAVPSRHAAQLVHQRLMATLLPVGRGRVAWPELARAAGDDAAAEAFDAALMDMPDG